MDAISEFCRFHGVPRTLHQRMRQHAAGVFAETDGIDIASISDGLPANLQLEVRACVRAGMCMRVRARRHVRA